MEDEKSIQSKGGEARGESLAPVKRSEIATLAANARWSKELPRATHTGIIVIAGRPLSCAVLETGKRLLTQETFLTAIGRAGKAKGKTGSFVVDGLPPFFAAQNLIPLISGDLTQATNPICFRH